MSVLATVGNQAQAEKDFQDKMVERMRQAMGDLMPDDVLKKIIERGLEEAFFKSTPRQEGTYANNWKTIEEQPSWVAAFVKIECAGRVQIAVEEWIASNGDKFKEIITGILDKGMASAVVASFDRLTAEPMTFLRDQILQITEKLRK